MTSGRGPAKPLNRKYQSSGLQLGYIDWGGSQTQQMILIHDLADSARTWDLLAPNVRDEYRVYAVQLRGHGDSDRPPGSQYSFEALYSDLVAFASEIDMHSAVLVGHGAGARLGAKLAVEYPMTVSSLVVYELESIEGHAETEWASFDEMVGYLKRQRPGASDSVLNRQGRSLSGGGLDGGRSFKHDPLAYSIYMADASAHWCDWSSIKCPSLVLRGRFSRDMTHAQAVHLAENIRLARIVEIENTGHWLHHEMPVAFEDVIRWFLGNSPN